MSYASLRSSGAQRLRSFHINDDSIHGTLLTCKTKKPHGVDWPLACPRKGVTGSTEWIRPLLDFRATHEKTNGFEPPFTFPRVNHLWELESAEPPTTPPHDGNLLSCASRSATNVGRRTRYTPLKICAIQRPSG